MRLRYTPRALADLREILDYIAARSPLGAQRVQSRLKATIELTVQHPRIGSRTKRPRQRRLVAVPYPYVIFYEATDREIIIHGVRHAARNPTSMPDRDD